MRDRDQRFDGRHGRFGRVWGEADAFRGLKQLEGNGKPPLLEESYRDATGTGTLLDPKHYESAYEKLARYSTLEEYLYTYSWRALT